MAQQQPFGQEFLRDILGELPEADFFSRLPELGSKRQRKFFKGNNQFEDIRNEFLGLIGADLRGGQDPSNRTFSNFLDDFDFQGRFFDEGGSQRGSNKKLFAPPTRFLF